MLVLSREVDQVILIGDDIEILVVKIERSCVRLAIKAPRHIKVDRKEIRLRTQQSKNENQ